MIPDSLIKEALLKIGYDKEDYLKIATEFNPDVFIYYMELAFATGNDFGITEERAKHANNMNKPVIMYDLNMEEIETFQSCTLAGRAVGRAKNSISSAAKKRRKCAGHYWKFV